MARAKKKPKKDPFAVRMKRRGREFKNLAQTLATEPKKLPRASLPIIRRSLRTVWDARGGGLFACGYVVAFVWLEVAMFIEDILAADSVSGFFGAQLFEMLFRYLGESFMNMILALMWPVHVVAFAPPFGAIGFGLAYAAFDKVFRGPIEAWLFDDDEALDQTNAQEEN